MAEAQVSGRYLLQGKLRLETPLLIGTGAETETNRPVVRDGDGKVYIPGTSLGGALRHFFKAEGRGIVASEQAERFWGSEIKKPETEVKTKPQRFQSSFYIADLRPIGPVQVVIRDGIALDRQGVVRDGSKYDYEVIEPGAVFDFRAEVILRACFDREAFEQLIEFVIKSCAQGKVFLGAMTTKGLGRSRLTDYECLKYDFRNKDDVFRWLAGETHGITPMEWKCETESQSGMNDFCLEVGLALKTSLIVRSYSDRPQESDAVHIHSAGNAVLPGTSIKGAIRARAERIITTLGGSSEQLHSLFGWAEEKRGVKNVKQKSRAIVEESVFRENELVTEQQTRIRIDRFTGGVCEGALFDSMPLWPKNPDCPVVEIKLHIVNCQPWEAGLLMLVLKDLWNEDLPLGGDKAIGRGVFTGVNARVCFKQREYRIGLNIHNMLQVNGEIAELENWVAELLRMCNLKEVSKG